MADITLTTAAVIPAGTGITVTVYEDTDDDDIANASASQAIATGTNVYTLSGFANTAGAKYSFKADFTSSDSAQAATLQSVQADQASGSSYVASGGAQSGGTAGVVMGALPPASGGGVGAGVAAVALGVALLASGGGLSGGTAVVQSGMVYGASGGAQSGGTADVSYNDAGGYAYVMAGGGLAGGAAVVQFGAVYGAGGGAMTGGLAAVSFTMGADMPLTLATVVGTLRDQQGQPQAGATLTLMLDRPDVDPTEGYLLPLAQVFTAAADGTVVAQVWPNDLGREGSRYRVTADTALGVRLFAGALAVPSAGGALFDLLDLGFVGPPDNPAPDNAREARLVADVADLLHEVPPSAETTRKVKRWIQLVLEDVAQGRRWWFLEHLSQGGIGAGEDVIDLRGDLDRVVAIYAPARLDKVPLAVIAEQRARAAREGRPNAGWPTQYALEGGRRVHLWPAPQQAMPFAIHYTRPMSVELPPPGWDAILVNGVLGLFGQHFDREALSQNPEYFEGRYREQLKRARLEHYDLERLPMWLRDDATRQVASGSQSSAAVSRTMPASLQGIGHVCIYELEVAP